MNAEELYLELKNALKFLGVSFHDKDKVSVFCEDGVLIFSYGGREASVLMPCAEDDLE